MQISQLTTEAHQCIIDSKKKENVTEQGRERSHHLKSQQVQGAA
jgi:hypothetical protein